MARIARRRAAVADLDDIWWYIAVDDIDAADRLIDRIEAACARLAPAPLMGSMRDELLAGLRSFVVGRYSIFFLPVPDGIELVRVLHGARDIGAIFDRET